MYDGPPIGFGVVQLCCAKDHDVAAIADDSVWQSTGGVRVSMRDEVERWSAAARERDDVLMFDVTERGASVGQVFLHDVDGQAGEAMVGYHLVKERFRGRGIGSEALRLLVDFVREETDLSTLVITTAGDNVASQRVAEKAGFERVGVPWEDSTACLFKLTIA